MVAWQQMATDGASALYLYKLESSGDTFVFQVTDLALVWREVLDSASIVSRTMRLQSAILLEDAHDAINFIDLLRGVLATPVSIDRDSKLIVKYRLPISDTTDASWEFELSPEPEPEMAIKALAMNLLEVIDNMNHSIAGLKTTNRELQYHIRNLVKLADEPYKPHQHQSSFTMSVESGNSAGIGESDVVLPSSESHSSQMQLPPSSPVATQQDFNYAEDSCARYKRGNSVLEEYWPEEKPSYNDPDVTVTLDSPQPVEDRKSALMKQLETQRKKKRRF